jgi:hypothetical protein
MHRSTCGLAAVAVAAMFAGSVQAQPLQFRFADTAGNFLNEFTIPAIGGTVDIRVYLSDTGAASNFFPNTTQMNNLNTYHLRGLGVRVQTSAPGVARINVLGDVTPNFSPDPPPDPPTPTVPHDTFNQIFARSINTPDQGDYNLSMGLLGWAGVTANGTGRVLLGTYRFTAFAAGQTTISFEDINVALGHSSLGSEGTGGNSGVVLDPIGLPPIPGLFSSMSIVVVPEPSSMILGGLAIAGFAAIRRRRYRREKAAEIAV